MKLLTKKLTAGQSFTLSSAYNCSQFSFQMSAADGDNGTYAGDQTDPVTQAVSTTNPLAAGQGRVYYSSGSVISGITVTCVTGTITIDIGY